MEIKKYIAESEKRYNIRIKTVVALDDQLISKIERCIAKYQPVEVTRAVKTIMQKHPLDFRNVENAEVWIIDVVFALPVSPFEMREEIRKALDAPETFVVVRNKNEQIEVETSYLNAMADIEEEAKKRGLVSASLLSTDPEYYEHDMVDPKTLAGNEYNVSFLSYLRTIQDERKPVEVKAKTTLFNWLKMPDRKDQEPYQSAEDFNKDISDAPRVAPNKTPKGFNNIIQGAINNQARVIKKVFVDKNGNRVVLSRSLGEEE